MSAELLATALAHHEAGRFPQAEQLYRQILAVDPQNSDAWHFLGLLAYQFGQPKPAIEWMGRAVQLSPKKALYYGNLALAFEADGQIERAVLCYNQAIELDPNHAEAHSNLSIVLQAQGRLAEAVMAAHRAVQLRPDYAEAFNNLGNIYHAQGRTAEAMAAYREALRLRPELAAVQANLGNVLADIRQFDQAEQCYRAAIERDPNYVPALVFLGNLNRTRGRLAEALACYQQAIGLNPRDILAQCNLGVALVELERVDEAQAAYRRAIDLDANHVDTLNNYANLHNRLGQFAEAERMLRKAIELRPQSTVGWNNLGTALQWQGRYEEARQAFEKALELAPDSLEALSNLGVVHYELRQIRQAIACCERVRVKQPNHVPAIDNLATIYADTGRYDEALAAYSRAQELAPRDGRLVRMALLTHVIYDSTDQMAAERARITQSAERMQSQSLNVTDPVNEVGATTFHLSYHGQNDREILQQVAKLHRHTSPALQYVAPHVQSPRIVSERPRVGFVSRYLYDHPVGVHYAGVLEKLSRDIHLTVFGFGDRNDEITRRIARRADEWVRLPTHLKACQQEIANRRLDALVYTDIGMDPLTYFLAFARLARVQAVAAGHPITSGIDTIDYFLSSDWLEPASADEHYSEKLVRFRSLPTGFNLPSRSEVRSSRRDFELPEDATLYTCGQTLFKIHPDFDGLLASILRSDVRGRGVFFKDELDAWWPRLQSSWSQAMPDVLDRIIWLPRQPIARFRDVLSLSDVVLDTPHFSGGTSTLEALAGGAPVVTLESSFMRGRVTSGCYLRMGLSDLIAHSSEEYVRLALRLGSDRPWRDQLVKQIESKRIALFAGDEFADELSLWLAQIVQQS